MMDRIERSQKQVNEDGRYEKGVSLQASIFGETIRQCRQDSPENQKHIQVYLSAFCFGDIYSHHRLLVQL